MVPLRSLHIRWLMCHSWAGSAGGCRRLRGRPDSTTGRTPSRATLHTVGNPRHHLLLLSRNHTRPVRGASVLKPVVPYSEDDIYVSDFTVAAASRRRHRPPLSPTEVQGIYSVFAGDSETISVISSRASQVASAAPRGASGGSYRATSSSSGGCSVNIDKVKPDPSALCK